MIRVLQVVPTLGYGGVAKVVMNYYDAIDHNAYHFDYVTHGNYENYHERLVSEGSKIYYFKTIGKIGAKQYSNQILMNLNLNDYDVVHIHTGDITGLYAKVFKKSGAKRIICHAHTAKAVSGLHQHFNWLFRYMALKYSNLTIACGYDAGDYCFGEGNYVLLPNSINYSKFNNVNKQDIERIKQELDISETSFVIGHVGHFSTQKNHMYIIDVAKKYIKRHPDSIFVLCGAGPLFDVIKERVSDENLENNFRFAGIRDDINVFMHLFDVFILPSLFEGLPVVGIEAQTAGLPCLLSDQIDHRVDIGCHLCQFIPINKGEELWVDAIEKYQNSTIAVNMDDVYAALKTHNYDISCTSRILTEAYDNLISSFR